MKNRHKPLLGNLDTHFCITKEIIYGAVIIWGACVAYMVKKFMNHNLNPGLKTSKDFKKQLKSSKNKDQ